MLRMLLFPYKLFPCHFNPNGKCSIQFPRHDRFRQLQLGLERPRWLAFRRRHGEPRREKLRLIIL